MIRLYQTTALNIGELIELDKNPSHHLIRVLRARAGSVVTLFNGDGHEYLAELVDDNPKHCHLRIKQRLKVENESPLRITLLQGISRGDRMDTAIQKSIELGVHAIIPVDCQCSGSSVKGERADKKHHHWQQIVISACEQSGRCYIPPVSSISSFSDAINLDNSSSKIILDPQAHLTFNQLQKLEGDIYLLIGPEGGFSDDEIRQACNSGFTAISLGPRILRTETAGPASIAIAQTLWGDLG
ncbi:MAG: 16S rRNA (uracil(1498)-N(3))-methyltransferase [Gammaproteobacteria bacterium]|nr:16S rRNA (uracil(1498)-N(3))-methyltransferase [Gammaproteobacteria bacterium]